MYGQNKLESQQDRTVGLSERPCQTRGAEQDSSRLEACPGQWRHAAGSFEALAPCLVQSSCGLWVHHPHGLQPRNTTQLTYMQGPPLYRGTDDLRCLSVPRSAGGNQLQMRVPP